MAGANTLNYATYRSAVAVNLTRGTATGTGGAANIVNAIGGASDDILVGNEMANVLKGNGGRDILIGGLGTDSLSGGGSSDLLIGGATLHDDDKATLSAIRNEWKGAVTSSERFLVGCMVRSF